MSGKAVTMFEQMNQHAIEVETYFAKCKAVGIDRDEASALLRQVAKTVSQSTEPTKATDLAWRRITEGRDTGA